MQHDAHVLLLPRLVQQIDGFPADGDAQRLRDRLRADPVQGGLFLVDGEPVPRLLVLDIPIHIHDARGLVEDVANLGSEGLPAPGVGAVNLGNERLQYGRAGGHLGDGDAGAEFFSDRGHARANAPGDAVTLNVALGFAGEIDLQVGHVRAAAQEIMLHKPVEVEGRGGPRVNLVTQERPAPARAVKHRPHHPPINADEKIIGPGVRAGIGSRGVLDMNRDLSDAAVRVLPVRLGRGWERRDIHHAKTGLGG